MGRGPASRIGPRVDSGPSDLTSAVHAGMILAAMAGWALLAWWQTQADRLAAQRYYDERARASELRDTLDTMHAILRRLDQRTP